MSIKKVLIFTHQVCDLHHFVLGFNLSLISKELRVHEFVDVFVNQHLLCNLGQNVVVVRSNLVWQTVQVVPRLNRNSDRLLKDFEEILEDATCISAI